MSSNTSNVVIGHLSPHDWMAYKATRLRSLQEAPDSFGSTYKREAAFTEEQWVARLSPSTNMIASTTLMAVEDNIGVGLISGVISAGVPEQANVYQMWVAPECRGCGVGTSMLDLLVGWAKQHHVQSLMLAVTTSNNEAVSLYASYGFKDTGDAEPLREGSELICKSMQLTFA